MLRLVAGGLVAVLSVVLAGGCVVVPSRSAFSNRDAAAQADAAGTDALDDANAPSDTAEASDAGTGDNAAKIDSDEVGGADMAPGADADAVADVFGPVDTPDAAIVDAPAATDSAGAQDADGAAAEDLAGDAADACAGVVCSQLPCASNLCDPSTGSCQPQPLPDGATCTDGDACTMADACADGQCLPGAATSCDDGNACTTDACTPMVGCSHAVTATTCDDGNACTAADACTDATCLGGAGVDCADDVTCTVDACAPATGCTHTTDDGACADGNACTDDACDAPTGCTHTDNTAPCADGDPCTIGETCTAGACPSGNVKDCDDGDPCTTDACEGASGDCTHVPLTTCGDAVCGCGESAINCAADCPAACGDGACNGDESVWTCAADCAALAVHLADPCTLAGAKDVCPLGYFCVTRGEAAGGPVCVADLDTWGALPVTRPGSDFAASSDFVADARTGLYWAKAATTGLSWSQALASCPDLTAGGWVDWRLPTRAELRSLVDFAKWTPAAAMPGLSWPGSDDTYWSAVPRVLGGHAWVVSFADGALNTAGVAQLHAARCVRSAAPVAGAGSIARFAVQDGGATVLDRLTGLRWQQGVAPATMNQSEAKSLCQGNGAGLAGSAWRLPTVTELSTLIDAAASNPATDAVFAGAPAEWFWTATAAGDGEAWRVSFNYGFSTPESVGAAAQVRCVTGDGACVALTTADCDDGNTCTDDLCDPTAGCTHVANTLACEDGNPCTLDDTCAASACVAGSPKCDDFWQCTADSCDAATGACTNAWEPTCGDGVCTWDCEENAVTCAADCPPMCGDGACNGEESYASCFSDCAFLRARLRNACTTPGSQDTCAHGYICVARGSAGGGNVCVADFETWDLQPEGYTLNGTGTTNWDAKTDLTWASEVLPSMNWSDALTACTAKTYASKKDWRLPTRAELLSLVSYSADSPATTMSKVTWPTDWTYWTAVPAAAAGKAWAVTFAAGHALPQSKDSNARVRCVRGGWTSAQQATVERFALTDGGLTVLDRATGLRWQQGVSAATFKPSDAATWCSNNSAGLPGTGWHLPNVRELTALIDSAATPAWDAAFGATAMYHWTTTPGAAYTNYRWYVDFADGKVTMTDSGSFNARCVH